MSKRSKKLLLFSLMLLFSVVILALGLKYFPFTKVMKMPAGSEQAFVNPQKIDVLSPNTLYYDFEIAPGKEMPGGFYKGLAHSGQYSVKAFGQNSFSITVERTAKEIGLQNLKAVAFSAWIYVFPTKNEVKGSMVFTASNELGVNVCWEGIGIVEPEVPRGKWFKVSKYIDLTPITFKPGYKIQVYFWNNSSTDILIDDYTVVFGGPVDRRGDSAWFDMTKPAGYIPRFNYPPFPVSLLEKENTGPKQKLAEIDANDKVIAGNFLDTGNDGLFVIGQDGRPAAWSFCAEKNEFQKVNLEIPPGFAALQPVKKIMKGRVLGTNTEQLILAGDKGWMLCALEPVSKPCGEPGALKSRLKILWKTEAPEPSIFVGDFNGDRKSEILVIGDNGTWKVMAFEQTGNAGGNWKLLAGDDKDPVEVWNKGNLELGVSVGKFIPGSVGEQVLSVARHKSDGTYSYTLLRFNTSRKKWDPVFSDKQNFNGKTIGLDTLKPTDLFFTAGTGNGNDVKVFRYNRDWRYDLREIRFNDTTFGIIASVDFHGYDRDQNPKFYETLLMIPGYFRDASSFSFLTIGSVAKERQYDSVLPDFVHLYSIPTKQ